MPEIHIIKEKNKGLMIKACKVQGVLVLRAKGVRVLSVLPPATQTKAEKASISPRLVSQQTPPAGDGSIWARRVSDRRRQIHQDDHMLIV